MDNLPRFPFSLSTPGRLGKWCAIAVLLAAPGSFIVLPAIWLARAWQLVKELESRIDWAMREG